MGLLSKGLAWNGVTTVSLVIAVCVGTSEVRVVLATSTVGRTRMPDLVFDRGTLTVREALRAARLLTSRAVVPPWENH